MKDFSLTKLPKLERYILSGTVIALAIAVVYISLLYTITPPNQPGQTLGTAQVIKSWNFDGSSTEGWRGRNTGAVSARNGALNITASPSKIGPLIYNLQVNTKMPYQIKYAAINLSFQNKSQSYNRIVTYPVFTLNFYYKNQNSNSWSKPIPLNGRISSSFREFRVKLPNISPSTIESLRIDFVNGITPGDTILIYSIKLLNENSVLPTRYPIPTKYYPPVTPNPTCTVPPPCYYGITDSSGNTVYCLPKILGEWCPVKPTPGVCVPYPPNCITWQNGKAIMTCQFIQAQNWCPLPTCRPRPACLDAKPISCMIAETPDMCPPNR